MGILGTGLQEGLLLKPIRYQWAMDLYDQAVANTWFPNEIQLGEDIADFKKMTDEERHAVTFLMSYFNPNELLVNKALAFGVYPYVSAAECSLYLAKQMWEEANHCMSFEYVLETFPIDREAAYAAHADIPSMARKEEFEVKYIRRMTEQTLDITTTEGKKDFIRNLVAYNVILEGVWFYSGFMVALSFRQRNLLRNFGSLIDQAREAARQGDRNRSLINLSAAIVSQASSLKQELGGLERLLNSNIDVLGRRLEEEPQNWDRISDVVETLTATWRQKEDEAVLRITKILATLEYVVNFEQAPPRST